MTKELFVAAALSYLGTPYRWGGSTPQGWDCSGFANELMTMAGAGMSGGKVSADEMYRYWEAISSSSAPGAGSLVFYGTLKPNGIEHVAVMLDENTVIEARGGDHTTVDLAHAVAQGAFVGVRPWNHRKDAVAVIRPTGLPW